MAEKQFHLKYSEYKIAIKPELQSNDNSQLTQLITSIKLL